MRMTLTIVTNSLLLCLNQCSMPSSSTCARECAENFQTIRWAADMRLLRFAARRARPVGRSRTIPESASSLRPSINYSTLMPLDTYTLRALYASFLGACRLVRGAGARSPRPRSFSWPRHVGPLPHQSYWKSCLPRGPPAR